MKKNCDLVLTIDNFDDIYSYWKGRTITIMGDYLKVSQSGLPSRYFDTIYLFEEIGVLIGFKYETPLPECYITTADGQESDVFVDAAPYIFYDLNHYYGVVKKEYRNIDLKKNVIGLSIIDLSTLITLDQHYTWPLWESIESINNGAILIKKADNNYGISTLDTFPACYVVGSAYSIKQDEDEENIYYVRKSVFSLEVKKMNLTKILSKIKLS